MPRARRWTGPLEASHGGAKAPVPRGGSGRETGVTWPEGVREGMQSQPEAEMGCLCPGSGSTPSL